MHGGCQHILTFNSVVAMVITWSVLQTSLALIGRIPPHVIFEQRMDLIGCVCVIALNFVFIHVRMRCLNQMVTLPLLCIASMSDVTQLILKYVF